MEVAILETLDRIGAGGDGRYTRCAKAVDRLDADYGVAPGPGYEALCDMARPWVVLLSTVDFHGNFGSVDFPPAAPSAVLHKAVRLLRGAELAPAYEDAFASWDDSDDAAAWDVTASDNV